MYPEERPFEAVVLDAVLAYNATPHPDLGASPYYAMFGREAVLPGWQRIMQPSDQEDKLLNLQQMRTDAIVRKLLRDDVISQRPIVPSRLFKVGDWVRWPLPVYQRRAVASSPSTEQSLKLVPKWSLPGRVTAVKSHQLLVQPLGAPPSRDPRVVPLSVVQKIPTSIPRSLAKLNLADIRRSAASLPMRVRSTPVSDPPVTFEDLVKSRDISP